MSCVCLVGGECNEPPYTMCWIHYKHEATEYESVYLVCGECGHVYKTAEELVQNWKDEVGRAAACVEQVHACPFCDHDF